MKKIGIFTVCVLSITILNAQNLREASMLRKFNLKSIESVIDERGRKVDKETKALRMNQNEYFESDETEASEITLSYLQAKQDVYGLSSNLNDIKVAKIQKSPSGEYVYCQQYLNDIPVYATNFIVYVNKEGIVKYTLNEFRNIDKYGNIGSKSSITNNDALKIAHKYLDIEDVNGEPKTELVYFESMDEGLELAWKIDLRAWRIFVSAETGRIIHAGDARVPATGSGKVFIPNPLVSANVPYGGNYVHNYGATNPYLDAELKTVPLNDLTVENSVYKLKGPYCVIEDVKLFGYNIPESSTGNFYYTRDQDEFKSVMCYYHVDSSARRILELGYWDSGLNSLRVDPQGEYADRNAYYRDTYNYLSFGFETYDYVDAAEDADVIWHEYGHAIQWNLGSANAENYENYIQMRAVLEGSADYWSTSYKRPLYPNNWAARTLWFCMDDYTPRRTDLNWIFPQDFFPTTPCHHIEQPCGHCAGQIWSSALMKIWGDLGRDITDQLFLEAHLIWGQSPAMWSAADAFMRADFHLYDGIHLCQIYDSFQKHGLIDPSQIVKTTNFTNETVPFKKLVFSCSDLNVQGVTVTSYYATLTLNAVGDINVQNVTVTNNATLILKAAGNIDIQDMDVINNSKLILDAAGEVNIIRNFEVELGSELDIR